MSNCGCEARRVHWGIPCVTPVEISRPAARKDLVLMTARIAAVVACALLLWLGLGCSSSQQESDAGATKPTGNVLHPPEPGESAQSVPPGHCRFFATVVSIDSLPAVPESAGPCSKAPCTATVRVDSVVAYGSAFPRPLAKGQLLHIRFIYTLNPSQLLFPGMKPGLPGLTSGDRFKADLEGTNTPVSAQDNGIAYTIRQYDKQ